MSEKEYPLPPATFDFLVLSLKTQIEVHLGLLYFGDEKERPEPEFRMARHSIDLLAMIQEKTRESRPWRNSGSSKTRWCVKP
jgi:Domain of unknown function (DUF1844)